MKGIAVQYSTVNNDKFMGRASHKGEHKKSTALHGSNNHS
jgi:hypothetical protein